MEDFYGDRQTETPRYQIWFYDGVNSKRAQKARSFFSGMTERYNVEGPVNLLGNDGIKFSTIKY